MASGESAAIAQWRARRAEALSCHMARNAWRARRGGACALSATILAQYLDIGISIEGPISMARMKWP